MGSPLRTRVKESITAVVPFHLTTLEEVQISAVAGKVMVTVFWDSVGVILVDFMPKGAIINSDVYIDTLKKLKARIQKLPVLEMSKVLLQHDNARPHIILKTSEVIGSFAWTRILHPLYLSDVAPSDFHLFEPLKETLKWRHFSSDEKAKAAVRKWLKTQPIEFYNKRICAFVRWKKAVRKAGNYIEK